MRRLQYWHCALGPSVHIPRIALDKQRAWNEWQGETIVYCLPGLREPERWFQRPFAEGPANIGCLAIPADNPELLTVFHIGDHGHVWGPQAEALFEGGTVEGLLERWLSLDIGQGQVVVGDGSFSLELPRVETGRVARKGNRLEVATFILEPEAVGVVPATAVEEPDGRRVLSFSWPPEGTGPRAVSPDAEIPARFGSHERTLVEGIAGATLPDGTWRPALGLRWPEPFATLFGPCAGLDAWYALARMRTVAQLAPNDRDRALVMAGTALAPYVAEARVPLWLACLGPDLMANRDHGPDVATWERYGLRGKTLEEVLKDPASSARVPVQRVWSGVGLLWALLVDRLEQAATLSTCGRCQQLLRGRKKYCNAEDNPTCYKARRAENQRDSRATRAAHGKRPRA